MLLKYTNTTAIKGCYLLYLEPYETGSNEFVK